MEAHFSERAMSVSRSSWVRLMTMVLCQVWEMPCDPAYARVMSQQGPEVTMSRQPAPQPSRGCTEDTLGGEGGWLGK